MKTTLLPAVFIFLLMLAACQKEIEAPASPEIISTQYKTLGTFDNSGRPDYLVTKDPISQDMLLFVDSILPENIDLGITNPHLINDPAFADIIITKTSDVYVSFVSEETTYAGALGFYTYPTGQYPPEAKDIRTITYIFPSAEYGTTLEAGDKVKIGKFNAGTSIGFVLLNDAWNADTQKLDNNTEHFFSTDILNPEADPSLKKHTVFVNYAPENKTLIGFENRNRSSPDCNNDFNDLVFYATITPN